MKSAVALPSALMTMLLAGACPVLGQVPSGTIAGVVSDPLRRPVADACVQITHQETGATWTLNSDPDGRYSVAILAPGSYRVAAQAPGYRRVERHAVVEAGSTTTVNVPLEPGSLTETVTVDEATPLLRHDQHQVAGAIRREQIENLPLNGRNFTDLVKLEPGVSGPVSGFGNRTFVAVLGSGLQTIPRVGNTRFTVDGASVAALGSAGIGLHLSPDVVQEFQLATVNFDAASGATTNGAANIVTRAGGNAHRGSAFGFYRDHHLSAYPGLQRDPRRPDPFFRRRQWGGVIGGPLRRSRLFYLGAYERTDQRGVVSVQPAGDLAHLGGLFDTPLTGDLASGRLDARLSAAHSLLVRYSRDGQRMFGSPAPGVLPSGWFRQRNRADQIVIGLTSVASARIVNQLRVSRLGLDSSNAPADARACPGCFGLGSPRTTVTGAGLTFGIVPNPFSFGGRRYQFTDHVTWQRGRHAWRFGAEWEHTTTRFAGPDEDVLQVTVWSPARVRQVNRASTAEAQIVLPSSFLTVEDVHALPLRSFQLSIGPGAALERGFRRHRVLDMYRLFAADTWSLGRALTLNLALAWSYEPNALNHDLAKPALLAPLLGNSGLGAPPVSRTDFSPSAGLAWTTGGGGTVVRAGIGIYRDPSGSTNATNLGNERLLLSPLGTGRLSVTGANIRSEGVRLDFPQPSGFSAHRLTMLLPDIRTNLAGGVQPDNRDWTLANLNRAKEGANLYDPSYRAPSAIHGAIGAQRELTHHVVLSADFVWKRFRHTFINGIDYNRFGSADGPLIPACADTERDDPRAACSNGPIMFDTTTGRARYTGVLVRAEARHRAVQMVVSYALGTYVGANGTGTGTAEMSSGQATGFSNDDWHGNYGPLPTDVRHRATVSGSIALPWRLQLGFIVSAGSRPPFTAWLQGVDLDGDGTISDLLPGSRVNQFGRGLEAGDLRRLVSRYNEIYAGRRLCCGQVAPAIAVPGDYSFNDAFFTQDLRLTHAVPFGRAAARLLVIAEIFNVLNAANLVQYSGNLLEPSSFGQPSARYTQVFGSGGPRAAQVGARLSF